LRLNKHAHFVADKAKAIDLGASDVHARHAARGKRRQNGAEHPQIQAVSHVWMAPGLQGLS